MNTPWLTIITITKNDPAGLRRTLQSCTTWRKGNGVEHIVVVGGDCMPESSEAEVIFMPQSTTGIAGAFNEGLARAQGEWVWFLNGGDSIHENLDAAWLLTLLKSTQAAVVTGALHYDGDESPRTAPPLRMQWPMVCSWLPHPATLVRRSTLKALGGFDPRWRFCMDFDLWYRLLGRAEKVDVVALPFARFDVTGISSRPENGPLLFQENAAVLWRYKGVILKTSWRKGWEMGLLFLRAAKNRWF